MKDHEESTTARALASAGDADSARDVGALDDVAKAVDLRIGSAQVGLVERLIFGPAPNTAELGSGGRVAREVSGTEHTAIEAALEMFVRGEAFSADGKLTQTLRDTVAANKAYGYTVPANFGGAAKSYAELAVLEEALAANGLGPLAVEISGQLTIGAGSILEYGDDHHRSTYLPMVAEGHLMAFGLTEVGVGVNAKKIQAYVEEDAEGNYRLFADGDKNKLWITNAVHGGIIGIVARDGRAGKNIGLFIAELPDHDVNRDGGNDYEFHLEPSGVAAFVANFNSRLHFDNFPIPKQNRIPADGVEVLFYCLRMGRCMLAAMASGYQRMLARDASHYAIQRHGVGGPVIRHEIPRLNLGKILGGALLARALCFLSLQQDADGVDLAGLRDITKSASASAGVESMVACEHVLGGRGFHAGTRVNEARVNLHLFGVVEGEDDLILMGMARDVTQRFVDRHLAPMLQAIQAANLTDEGELLPREERLLSIGPLTVLRHPKRSFAAIRKLLFDYDFWRLLAWIAANAASDFVRLPLRLLPASCFGRYRILPPTLRSHARFAERALRRMRWTYLGMSMIFQLELTRAQIPLQRFGKCVELLVSILAVCHHAASGDESEQRIARLEALLLKDKYRGIRIMSGLRSMANMRSAVGALGQSIEQESCSMISGINAQAFGHPWEDAKQPASHSAPAKT